MEKYSITKILIIALLFCITPTLATSLQWQRSNATEKSLSSQTTFLVKMARMIPNKTPLRLHALFYTAEEDVQSVNFGVPQSILLKNYYGWGAYYGQLRNWHNDPFTAIAEKFGCTCEHFFWLWNNRVNAAFLCKAKKPNPPNLILCIQVPQDGIMSRDFFVPYADDISGWIDRNTLLAQKYVDEPGDCDKFIAKILTNPHVVGFLVSPHP